MASGSGKKGRFNFILPLVGIFLLVLMVFVLIFGNTIIRESVWSQSIDDNMQVTAQSALVISSVMNKYIAEAEGYLFYADDAFHSYPDEFDAFEASRGYAAELDCYRLISYLDDGRILNDSGNALNYAPAEVAAMAEKGVSGISEPYFDNEILKGDAFVVYVSDPLKETVKAVGAYFSSARLYNDCGFSIGEKCLYFVNTEGTIIFAPFEYQKYNSETHTSVSDALGAPADPEAEDTFKQDIMAAIANGAEISVGDIEGRRIASVAKIAGTDWSVVMLVPNAVLPEGINSALQSVLIVGIIVLSCYLGMFFYFTFSNRKYITRMANAENTDPIAQCANQSKFEADSASLLADNSNTKYAMIYMNIKNFNYISNIYGFQTANDLLLYVSKVIAKALERRETYGRLTDGRFAMLVRVSDGTNERLTQMVDHVSDFTTLKNSRYRAKIVLGVYEIDRNAGYTVAEMIDRAVIAQEAVGENSDKIFVYYQAESHEELLKIAEIEEAMESALKSGQFKMYLQPKYNILHDRIDGAEALVRWVRPDGNMVMPSKFIPIFERNGFIAELDKYIFVQACLLIQDLIKNGKRVVPISVNVSRASAQNPDFLDFYIKTKKHYGIADYFLELEFTESLAMENYDVLSQTLSVLRANGFSCAIDDFGEGFSSYKALKTLPFDVIKLDKFFLMKSQNRNRDEYLLAGVVAMAKALEMKVITEGVETSEELAMLKRIKCDAIQGYLYSRPIPVEDYRVFLENAFKKTPVQMKD